MIVSCYSLPHSLHCVLCHGIVDLVLCFCDRVVSLWNSGGGLCDVGGRGVYCLHAIRVVVCISVVGVCDDNV